MTTITQDEEILGEVTYGDNTINTRNMSNSEFKFEKSYSVSEIYNVMVTAYSYSINSWLAGSVNRTIKSKRC